MGVQASCRQIGGGGSRSRAHRLAILFCTCVLEEPAEEWTSEAIPHSTHHDPETLWQSFPLTMATVASLPQPACSPFVLIPPLTPWSPVWPELGADGHRLLAHRCSCGFLWFQEFSLQKLVWVCFFVLFYSLFCILSPSVLNHLSADLIQFTEFLLELV